MLVTRIVRIHYKSVDKLEDNYIKNHWTREGDWYIFTIEYEINWV